MATCDHLIGDDNEPGGGYVRASELPEMQELYAKAKLAPHGVAGAVSRYASTNIAEFIAESWAEYKNNPTPRKMAAEVGDLIRKAYARKYWNE